MQTAMIRENWLPRVLAMLFARWQFVVIGLATTGLVPAVAPALYAQQPEESEENIDAAAQLVTIRLPLTGKDDALYQGILQRAAEKLRRVARPNEQRPTLILEFAVDPKRELPDGRGSQFERALSLARFLTSDELTGLRTVAYLPRTIKGHAVLVAMACEEIAMAPGAEIGEAAIDEPDDRPVEQGMAALYRQIAEARRTVPPAIAIGWIDRRQEVLKVESEDRIDLVLRDEVAKIEKERTVLDTELLVPAGAFGLQTGRQGRELGFVKYLAVDRQALARTLRLPASAVSEDQSLVAEWRPVLIDLEGPVTARKVRQIETLIAEEIDKRGTNWIGLRMDSSGGDMTQCLRLAATLAELDSSQVRTIAYVPMEAAGGSALIALACDQLVMQPGAHVGGGIPPAQAEVEKAEDAGRVLPPKNEKLEKPAAEELPGGEENVAEIDTEAIELAAALSTIRESLAEKTNHTASTLAALIDSETAVYRYTHRETGAERLFSEAEAGRQPDGPKWRRGEVITKPGEALRLDAERAQQLGIATQVVDSIDDLNRLYGFAEIPRVAKPNWANEFVEALASPQLAMLLLLIGFVGIYVELNMPGVGFGGFIAALAFILFFWSKFTTQTADWLEVMLFITGVLFILMELLVIPGFGVFGFGGAVLVLASLVLASQTFLLPKTASQMAELRSSLSSVAGALVAFFVVGLAIRRFLPETALFRQMQLAPPEGAELIELDHRESAADYSHLVGMTGNTTTDLRPSGRAQIGGELLDVIAQDGVIDRGTEVEVVQAKSNRVLVRAVRG